MRAVAHRSSTEWCHWHQNIRVDEINRENYPRPALVLVTVDA